MTETCERVLRDRDRLRLPDGRLVVPVGRAEAQELVRVVNRDRSVHVETIDRARFVLLVGEHGW